MTISIICVGKIKESFYREAVEEYCKRLSRFCKIEIVEVAEELPNGINSDAQLQAVKLAEGKRIVAKLKGFVILLDIHGQEFASEELAEKLDKLASGGVSQICFVIGGSYGVSQEVRDKADEKMSFGKATFPHQLMRVVLTEQIYRAYMINSGSAYHK
ncbi:MAG: 23S rRNA (pseudouridine(1915)-N(3))-methyltransferase RlmH [Clostridia bacterium]